MLVDRMSYIVFFKGTQVINKLNELPVNITYISKKKKFAVIYMDKAHEDHVKKVLKNTNGFKGFTQSQTFDENFNFDVK